MRNKKHLLLGAICLFFTAEGIFAEAEIPGLDVVFMPAVKDIRVFNGVPSASTVRSARNRSAVNTAAADGRESVKDLRVGDIFINIDGNARQVSSISTGTRGEQIIETVQPRMADVFAGLVIPEFTLNVGNEDFVYLAPGVELAPEDESAYPNLFDSLETESRSLTVTDNGDGPHLATVASDASGMGSAGGYWWDNDPRRNDWRDGRGNKTGSLNINFNIKDSGLDASDINKLKSYQSAAVTNFKNKYGRNPQTTPPAISSTALVHVQGNLRYAAAIKASLNKPWTKWKWGFIPLPQGGNFGFAVHLLQQFDGNISMGLKKKKEYSQLLGTFAVPDPSGLVVVYFDLYFKANINGMIYFTMDFSEYTFAWVELKADINPLWLGIRNIGAKSDLYVNVALKPGLAAEIDMQEGPFPGLGLKAAGFTLGYINCGAGPYFNAYGYFQPDGIIGYKKGFGNSANYPSGFYNNIQNRWLINGKMSEGVFFDSKLEVLDGLWDTDLYNNRWEFWRLP
ncbi:MAG: hypothetical protein LBG72_07040 [Spirochaetaceae bacterium]|jgi:hypothetical protein|nr:hypothetical protein [Spirochaetaceae bacterium]